MGRTRVAVLCVVLLISAFSSGCDRLTRNRFEMIVVETSTKDDVRRTIGDPSDDLRDQWLYTRPGRHLTVMVNFNSQDVVMRKQWVDGLNNEWVDTLLPGDTDTSESTNIRRIN